MRRSRRSHRNDLGSLFATSVVVVLGMTICLVLYLVSQPRPSIWVEAGIVATALFFLGTALGIRMPRPGSGLEFWHSLFRERADSERAVDYTPEILRPHDPSRPGQNRPATAEELRELRLLSSSTWVPSRSRRRKDTDPETARRRRSKNPVLSRSSEQKSVAPGRSTRRPDGEPDGPLILD